MEIVLNPRPSMASAFKLADFDAVPKKDYSMVGQLARQLAEAVDELIVEDYTQHQEEKARHYKRPPLGLTPSYAFYGTKQERIKAIREAMARYEEDEKHIPTHWHYELKQLTTNYWRYRFPTIAFLLLGHDYHGRVEGDSKGECRARLKRRFKLKALPVGLELVRE